MQKLSKRNTYTPTGASLARCNCDSVLNKDESLSVQDLKTFDNNPEENQQQHRAGLNSNVSNIVYVLNMDKKPLMPTTPGKARRLLKCSKAKVVKRFPFTIQLNYLCGKATQPITCGVDTDYKNIGVSCVSKNKELFSANIETDTKTKERLDTKRMYRRNRRSRLWHRKPRFSNRKKGSGWLPPSISRLHNLHISFVENLKKILPITKIVFELGNFDVQKIKNLNIKEIEYQQGDIHQYNNIKEYLLSREKGKCQYCKKEKKDKFVIHYIISKNKQGSNRLNNLALVHDKCHKEIHKKNIQLQCNKPRNYKTTTFMNIIKSKILKETDYDVTFGYITKSIRCKLDLSKTHVKDAFVIAGGINQERINSFGIKHKHRNNRSIQKNRKGFKPSIRRRRYPNQPGDLVEYERREYNVKGTHCYGSQILLKNSPKNISVSIKKIVEKFHFGILIYLKEDGLASSTN
ncbi:MAG: RNA-guided endonuclease IscB [bacterium]